MKIQLNILRQHPLAAMVLLALTAMQETRAQSPDTIRLSDCHRWAIENHPLQVQKDLYRQSMDLKQKNQTANWYPSLDLNGKYTWQNEVVEIPFSGMMTGLDEFAMPHYNYKLTLDVQQTLYDGGLSRYGKEKEEAAFEVNRQKVEVSLNHLKDKVNQSYFYLLILQQQERIIRLKLDELKARSAVLESLVRNETILPSELSIMKAESLKVEQQLREISIRRNSALAVLRDLTQMDIPEGAFLVLPDTEIEPGREVVLPEHILFDLQIRNLDAGIRLTGRKRYPRAFVFGQFGYGNPALDFFRDEFRGYYILGGGLQWKIWDWSRTSREKQLLAVQQDIVRSEQEAFDRNLEILLEGYSADIARFEEAIRSDKEILELRRQITSTAASQLDNGTITSTDYITELNAETLARIQLEMHRIQLEQARTSYLTSKGMI